MSCDPKVTVFVLFIAATPAWHNKSKCVLHRNNTMLYFLYINYLTRRRAHPGGHCILNLQMGKRRHGD